MKPAAFRYHTATSVAHAAELLAHLGEESRLISGGQSLGVMLNLRVVRPSDIIDVSRVSELRRLIQNDDQSLSVGAAVTHANIEDSSVVGVAPDILRHVAHGIAYRSVRNRGTMGGSIAHADPAADWPPVLCALDAVVSIASTDAQARSVPCRSFFLGTYETALRQGDVIERIVVPALDPATRWGFSKHVLSHGGFASALALCILPPDSAPQLWLGATGGQPLDASAALARVPLDRGGDRPSELMEAILAGIELADETDHARYARHLHAVNAVRSVEKARR